MRNLENRTCRAAGVLLLLLGACLARAEERAPPTERDVQRAEVLAEQGEMRGALLALLRVMREAPSEELRHAAREHLRQWGLEPQEILRLDPATQKPEEVDALIARLTATRQLLERQEMEANFARRLAELSVLVRLGADGQAQVEVQAKDLARAVGMLIEVALSPRGGESVEHARGMVEQLGLVGAKLEAARKAAAEGQLPAEVQSEVVAGVCLERLHRYSEWLSEENADAEELVRRDVARVLGRALFTYCDKHFPNCAAFKRGGEVIEFWRAAAKNPPPPGDRF
jgi:hypothetical protein